MVDPEQLVSTAVGNSTGITDGILNSKSLLVFAMIAVVYTALVFRDDGFSSKGPLFFKQKTARLLVRLAGIHVVFLVTILSILLLIYELAPFFPGWMTKTLHSHSVDISGVDITFIAAFVLMHWIERIFLFSQIRRDPSEET
jgi:hypothetical protein